VLHIRKSLVDEKVCSFAEWKSGLHDEDIHEFGYRIHRSEKDYKLLYDMYVKFQTKPEVQAIREKMKDEK